jgi:hypothetical protein
MAFFQRMKYAMAYIQLTLERNPTSLFCMPFGYYNVIATAAGQAKLMLQHDWLIS